MHQEIGGCVNPNLDNKTIEAHGRDDPFYVDFVPWQFTLQERTRFVVEGRMTLTNRDPYDAAGWTLAMQMDVQVVRSLEALEGPFEPVADPTAFPVADLDLGTVGWTLAPQNSHSVLAVNRLLAAGAAVEWSPRGHWFVRRSDAARNVLMATPALGAGLVAVDRETREARRPVATARIGLFDV